MTATKRGRPRKHTEPAPKPAFPKGTTHVSSNGRDWHKACNARQNVKYARTDDMRYFRRVREQDLRHKQGTRWLSVTAAHVETAGKERWHG